MHARFLGRIRARRLRTGAVLSGGLLGGMAMDGHGRKSVTFMSTSPERPGPVLRFGAIADVQYADVDDQMNHMKTQLRRYRGSLVCLRNAVKDWLLEPRLHFVVDLGDMIDQQCESAGNSRAALELVLREWSALRVPVHHLVGNHELYNFNRAECQELIPNITPWYRSFKPVDGWRVVVLDPYELNMIERGGGVVVDAGLEFLSARNPNDLRAPRGTVDVSKGMVGLRRRFLPMGGALGNEQLLWLRDVLLTAREAGERIIILSHLPILPESTVPGALLWNFEETLDVIREFGGNVALVLTGHFHAGGYAVDETGTHHLTLPSPLHAELSDPRAHCTVEVMEDRIDIVGCGLIQSRSLILPTTDLPKRRASPPAKL